MSLFNNDYYNKTKPDLKDPVPQNGLKRWLFIFSNHFSRLISLNLLFIVFCIPVVTIPAALCGLTNAASVLYKTGTCSVFRDFWEEFRRNIFGRFTVIFLLLFVPVSLCLWLSAFGLSSLGTGILIGLLPICLVTLCYFVAFSVGVKPAGITCSSTFECLRAAFFAVPVYLKQSLKLFIVPVLLYCLCGFYYLYSMIAVIFILFSAGQLALCCIVSDIDIKYSHR